MIILARVDERLIHGVVVTDWFGKLQPKRFLVIDDAISQDEMLKSSMRMAKPAGTGMSILNFETALQNILSGKYDEQRVFLITKKPETYLKLIEAGVEIPKVDVGIIFDGPTKKKISKFVAVDDEDVAALKQIKALGVPVTLQYVPNDPEKDIEEFI